VHLVGGSARTGHAHADRGNLLLEAFGEELLIDRGICSYMDARADEMKRSCMHNLVTPVDNDGSFPDQAYPYAGATVPTGRGDERTLRAAIDVTGAWAGRFTVCRRRLRSDSPAELIIEDRLELPATGAVAFHLQSRLPFRRDGEAWVLQGRQAQLRIEPRWPLAHAAAGIAGIDSLGHPVHRLTLQAGPANRHLLRTKLSLKATRNE